MILPDAERAFVDPAKVRDYLLALDHPEGGDKARVFVAAGFSAADWKLLVHQLQRLARLAPSRPGRASPFGRKYEINGIIQSPTGDFMRVRTIWMIHHGEDFPRLITAYPGGQR